MNFVPLARNIRSSGNALWFSALDYDDDSTPRNYVRSVKYDLHGNFLGMISVEPLKHLDSNRYFKSMHSGCEGLAPGQFVRVM